MACPVTLHMSDVTGSYTINKTLSDDPEPSMSLRGVAWPMRKAMKVAPPLTFTIRHDIAAEPKTLTVSIPGIGPMKPHDEVQRLDWEWDERKNPLFGTIKARCKLMSWEEIKEEFLRKGWCEPTVMWGEEISEKGGWEAVNVWGFMLVDGERRYVRKTWIKNKKGEENNTRVIHDYKPIAA